MFSYCQGMADCLVCLVRYYRLVPCRMFVWIFVSGFRLLVYNIGMAIAGPSDQNTPMPTENGLK